MGGSTTLRPKKDLRASRCRGWRALLVAVFAFSGCAYTGGVGDYFRKGFKVGPEYRKPVAEVEQDWIDAYDDRIREDLPDYEDWWSVFNDPHLTALIETAYQQNLPLQEAGLRVLEARAQLGIAVGSFFPQRQEAFGSYSRRQISTTSLDDRPLIAAMVPRTFDRWTTGFDAAWELDVWGKFRRNIEAADAHLDASIEAYDDILLCLLAETAATYVEMRTAQDRLRLARKNVEAQKGSLAIAQSRFKAGETDELDVFQAQTNVKNTEALIPSFEQMERNAQIRLCVLMGIPPRDLTTDLGRAPIPDTPTTVALGIPADLLRRRPDVRKAEREVAVQSAKIGVAAADLLPQFSIKGAIRLDAQRFQELFNSGSVSGVISPGFAWSILNYGRLTNNVLMQDARFQQRAVNYLQTVLKANADVERSVNDFLQGQERVKLLTEAVAANQQALKIVLDQYKAGEANYNQIFTLQSFLVQEEDALAEAQGEVARSLIGIYKALGGGWRIRLDCGPREVVMSEESVAPEEVAPPIPTEEIVPGEIRRAPLPPENLRIDELPRRIPDAAPPPSRGLQFAPPPVPSAFQWRRSGRR
jgi:NodT family efflux transporter outer membrane factor (OMF) lipoprotein